MSGSKIKKVADFLEKSAKFQRTQPSAALAEMAKKTNTEIEEWVSTDEKNVSEVIVSATGDFVNAVIRFPLSQRLVTEQVSQHASELLKLSSSVGANIGLVADRLTLSFNASSRADEADKCVAAVEANLRNGALAATRLRELIGTNMKLPTNVAQDALYQSKLGKPVKLDAADLAIAQGGDVRSVIASVAGVLMGVAGAVGALTVVGGPVGALAGGGGLAVGAAEVGYDIVDTAVAAIPNYTPPPPRTPPSKGRYCFTEDTVVATPTGAKPIGQVAVGERVIATTADGRRVASRVVAVQRHDVETTLVTLTLGGGRTLRASMGHPVLTTEGWLNVEQLSPASVLVGAAGETRVLATASAAASVSLVNLQTEAGTYLVGDAGIIASSVVNATSASATA